jgi:hypothetical protein
LTRTTLATIGLALCSLTGCCFGVADALGDPGGGGGSDAPLYTLLETSVATCGDAGPTSDTSTEILQFSGSGSSISYTSQDGCTFDFNVDNSVGTLSNGPVTCNATTDGGPAELVVSAYTLDFSDAGGDPQIVISQTATYTQGSTSCVVTLNGSGAE